MNKTERRWIEIDHMMERFDVEPEGLLDHIERTKPQFLFYSQKNKHAYCTACKHTLKPFKGLRHNHFFECPECGARVIAKAEGIAHNTQDIFWSLWVQNDGDDLCLHYYRTVSDYSDYEHPYTDTTEEYRNIFDGDGYHDYMWWRTNRIGVVDKYRWLPYTKRGMWWNSYKSVYYEPDTVHLVNNPSEAIGKSRFKYCPIDGLLDLFGRNEDGSIRAYSIDCWLNEYRRQPQIELTYKVGFNALTLAMARGEKPEVNTNATNVCDALGITRSQFKRLRKIGDPSASELKAIKDFDCEPEDAAWVGKLLNNNYWARDKLKDLIQYAPVSALRHYLEGIKNDIVSYHDYVSWLISLNYDIKNKSVLFPKDFRKAHDKTQDEYVAERDRATNEGIAATAEKVDYCMHYNGLFIRPAQTAAELSNEGKTLHHCVATYANRMAKGETVILFVRKESEPDTPFYTMEVQNNEIVQLRGMRNCDPTPEVAEFRAEFEKVLKAPRIKKIAA